MKNIIVLGGGTAGLISAITIKQTFPEYSVKVIESDSIGIIGVGEGSTEHWRSWSEYCKIDIRDIIRETDGALKKGIKFENWNGDGKSYFHSLQEPFYTPNQPINVDAFAKTLIVENIKLEDVLLETSLINYRAGLFAVNQFHFNTFKLNAYLHKLCSQRNISVIASTIKDVVLTETGDVNYIIGEDDATYTADLFVDSSGFKRIIATKVGAEWVSYKKYLPMNHALAFPTDDITDLKPYTLSRALSSGWNWRISTQGRYGNGYVFDDNFIDATKAHDEVQSFYTEEVKVAKDIKFEAGRVDKFWINNCVSIGLSASFVEPLEASSIGNSILQSFGLCEMLEGWFIDRSVAEDYNKKFIACFDNIVDFVQLHYMTKRNDTEFWKTLPERMIKTPFIEQNLDLFKRSLPQYYKFGGINTYTMFNAPNWTQVMAGLELFDKDFLRDRLIETHGDIKDNQLKMYESYLSDVEKHSYIDHKILLEQNKLVVKLDRK
jgi:tryptophan halogenase